MEKADGKKKDKNEKVDENEIAWVGAFSIKEQKIIIGNAFNKCPLATPLDVTNKVSQWCDEVRKFSIILDAVIEQKVAVGVAQNGHLSFGIIDDDCDAATLIKDMMTEESKSVGLDGKPAH